MTRQQLVDKQKRMDAFRRRAGAAMKTWDVTTVDGKIALIASEGPDSEIVAILSDEASLDNRDYLLHSASEGFFVLEQFDALSKLRRGPRPDQQQSLAIHKQEDIAQQCGRLCNDRAFRAFLSTRKNIDTSDAERTVVAVRERLGVQSRSELKTNREAAARWRDLFAEFQIWMRDL